MQKRSHVAIGFANGLPEFRRARAFALSESSIEPATRAAQVAATGHERSRQGLRTLGTVATTAPMVGRFGTVTGILSSFRAVGMNRATYLALSACSIAEALICVAVEMLEASPLSGAAIG